MLMNGGVGQEEWSGVVVVRCGVTVQIVVRHRVRQGRSELIDTGRWRRRTTVITGVNGQIGERFTDFTTGGVEVW